MSVSVPDAQALSAEGYVPQTLLGAALNAAMSPWLTLHMAWVNDCVGAMAADWWDLAQDVGVDDGITPTVGTYKNGELVTEGYQPGYAAALNAQTATGSQLAYLSQYVGVVFPLGADDATARALILQESGFNRGRPASVISAATRYLVGTQSVNLLERLNYLGDPAAYSFLIAVRPEELIWNLVPNPSFENITLSDLEADYSTITALEAAFGTISALETEPVAPGGWTTPAFSGAGTLVTWAVQDGWAAAGFRSVRITGTGVAAGGTMHGSLSANVAAIAGQPYFAQATFNVLAPFTEPQLTVTFYNSSSAVVGTDTISGTVTTGVQTLSGDFMAPAGAVTANVTWGLLNTSAAAAGVDSYLDAVQLVESSVPRAYVDGDSAGYEWVANPGASETLSTLGLIAAVNATKPARVTWTLTQTDTWTISEMEASESMLSALEGDFSTITDLEQDVT